MQVPAGGGACYPMGCFWDSLNATFNTPPLPTEGVGGVTDLWKNPTEARARSCSFASEPFLAAFRHRDPRWWSLGVFTPASHQGATKKDVNHSHWVVGRSSVPRYIPHGRVWTPPPPSRGPPLRATNPRGWVFPYGHTHSRGTQVPPTPQASEGNWGRRGSRTPYPGRRESRNPTIFPIRKRGWAPSHTNQPSPLPPPPRQRALPSAWTVHGDGAGRGPGRPLGGAWENPPMAEGWQPPPTGWEVTDGQVWYCVFFLNTWAVTGKSKKEKIENAPKCEKFPF